MAGAWVGGSVANEGQQQRFENERIVRLQDVRIAAYSTLVEEVINLGIVGGTPEKVQAAVGRVLLLSSSPAVREAAKDLSEPHPDQDPNIEQKLDAFIELGHEEVSLDE